MSDRRIVIRWPGSLVLLGAVLIVARSGAQESPGAPESPEPAPKNAIEETNPSPAPPVSSVGFPQIEWFERTLAALREKELARDDGALARSWLEATVRVEDPDARVFAPDESPSTEDPPPATPPFCETETLPRRLVRLEVKRLASGAGLAIGAALDRAFRDGAKGIVLDLRWAGGDSLADLAHVASRYAATGELLCEVQSLGGRTIEQLSALPGARGADQNSPPTVVLVGPETRGAAEVLVALLDRRRGVMTIGRDTAHDLPIRETLVLPDGWSARVATRRIVFPEGGALDARHRFTPRLKLPAQLPPDPEEPEANGDWLDRRKTLPQEEEDRQLRARLRGDPELRSAVDLLLALAALRSAD